MRFMYKRQRSIIIIMFNLIIRIDSPARPRCYVRSRHTSMPSLTHPSALTVQPQAIVLLLFSCDAVLRAIYSLLS